MLPGRFTVLTRRCLTATTPGSTRLPRPIGAPCQTCFYDFGPFNLITPESERTGLMVLAHQGFGNDLEVFTEIAAAQLFDRAGRANAARR